MNAAGNASKGDKSIRMCIDDKYLWRDQQYPKRPPARGNPQKVLKKAQYGRETGGLTLSNLNVPAVIPPTVAMIPPQAETVDSQKDRETDQQRIQHRKQQIAYGKNTLGYEQYLKAVPIGQRRSEHPCTPDPYEKLSKRHFDGKVKLWRRQLHDWDANQQPYIHNNQASHSPSCCSCQAVRRLAEEAGIIGGASFALLLSRALGGDVLDDDTDDAGGAGGTLTMPDENLLLDNASSLHHSTHQVGCDVRSSPGSISRRANLKYYGLREDFDEAMPVSATCGHISATTHAALSFVFDDFDYEALLTG